MNDYYIPCYQIFDLYIDTIKTSITTGLKPYDLSVWLKSKTDNKFVVIERRFIIEAIEHLNLNCCSDLSCGHDFKMRWNLKKIKDSI